MSDINATKKEKHENPTEDIREKSEKILATTNLLQRMLWAIKNILRTLGIRF